MIITIGRTFGSGGRITGMKLAEKLGIKFYDKELTRIMSDETGIAEQLFGESDEHLKKKYIGTDLSWMEEKPLPPSNKKYSSEGNLFRLQAEKIRQLADGEDCIIMGRCANMVLKDRTDCIRIFCYASADNCKKRAMEVCGLDEKEIVKKISITDRFREDYYRHFTGMNLSDAHNYDLCVNTGSHTVDELTDMLYNYIKSWQKGIK